MFRNHEFRVRVAKRADENAPTVERQPLLTQDELETVKDFMKVSALFFGGVYLVGKIVDAGCAIAVHHGTK